MLTILSDAIRDIGLLNSFSEIGIKVLLPLAIGSIVAGFIGLERQNIGKAAGVSSHFLVALSTVGIAIFQRLFFDMQMEYALLGLPVRPEGQRVIAQVLTGVGFIGAGVILKDKNNLIKGITTATTIWSVALISIILGSGYIILGSLLGVVMVLFIYIRDFLRGLNPFVHIDIQREDREIEDRDDQ